MEVSKTNPSQGVLRWGGRFVVALVVSLLAVGSSSASAHTYVTAPWVSSGAYNWNGSCGQAASHDSGWNAIFANARATTSGNTNCTSVGTRVVAKTIGFHRAPSYQYHHYAWSAWKFTSSTNQITATKTWESVCAGHGGYCGYTVSSAQYRAYVGWNYRYKSHYAW